MIKSRGSGNLNINLDPKGNLGISGDYFIDNGDYLFTLGNVLNKPFSVENGGKVTFSGDIDNAEIDLKAIYRLKASLFEILQDERFNERIPVECQILLSGKLFNPVVGFNIDLPSADEERRAYLNNVITTEEELEGFMIVKTILRQKISVTRVTYRDAQSYFAILLDDNNRKTICRLYLNGSKKYFVTLDEQKKEVKNEITSLDDIFKHAETLFSIVDNYDKSNETA